MSSAGLIGALLGGLVGVVAWAAIAVYAGYELGYVAWAIGGVVGFGAVKLGGRGSTLAVVAAVVSLASIFLGKVVANQMILNREVDAVQAGLTQADYDEAVADAEALSKLTSGDDDRQFMFDRGYSDAETPQSIRESDIENFRQYQVPVLKRLHGEKLDIDSWRSAVSDSAFGELSVMSLVLEELNAMDLLFAALGVATAFGIVMKAGAESSDVSADEDTNAPAA